MADTALSIPWSSFFCLINATEDTKLHSSLIKQKQKILTSNLSLMNSSLPVKISLQTGKGVYSFQE